VEPGTHQVQDRLHRSPFGPGDPQADGWHEHELETSMNLPGMDTDSITRLLDQQEQVLSREQVIARGGSDNDIARKLRRREWAQVHPGVYVGHTGPLTREQDEWAALLYYAPAALTGRSAMRAYGLLLGRDLEPSERHRMVHLAVDRHRRLKARPGTRLTRMQRFEQDVLENYSPPRVRLEHVVLELASAARREVDAVAVICDAVQSRRTTAGRLLAALEVRPRLRHRALLRRILADVASGAYSVLEREYLLRVERPHGLPTGARQRRVRFGRSSAYRDVDYLQHATIVELDGRLGHEAATDRWSDLERDIDSAVAGSLTVRLGWGQVLDPCRVAAAVHRVLLTRGWTGRPRGCSPACPMSRISGAKHAPGARQTPQIA